MMWPIRKPRAKTPDTRGYAICTVPRSGSNFVGQVLASTGLLGRPLEYFNGPGRRHFEDPTFPDDPEMQIGRILSDGATPNGIYAVKLFPFQLDAVQERIKWTSLLPQLHFVHLVRRDMLAQALSWSRAIQTVQYRHDQVPQATPNYDATHILKCLHDIARLNARWEVYFATNGISPLEMVYEDILANPQRGVEEVARLFDLPSLPMADMTKITLQRQSDELSEQWRQRFLADAGNRDKISDLMP
jgi:trehalose 2-sulfotransferase